MLGYSLFVYRVELNKTFNDIRRFRGHRLRRRGPRRNANMNGNFSATNFYYGKNMYV